jgi:D-alanyl-D-alanine carboxypeptidase/D-alanyl-D-alanine-endopeptidase (penicillin-binding protein 4)
MGYNRGRLDARARRIVGTAVLALSALALAACASGGQPGRSGTTGPDDLTKALLKIESQKKYDGTDWGYIAVDQKTGKVLASQNADNRFDPGSTMKSFSVFSALKAYGSDHTFKTPVYRTGSVSGGTLTGDLVVVASGDLSFGLRQEPGGALYYENLPVLDHSYATVGVPGAVEPPGDPLSVFDDYAKAVKAAGITTVQGNVVIDDRLFQPIQWPDGLVSPMWVNENLIDIEVTPGAKAGDPTSVQWRPQVAPYTVDSKVTTVDAKKTPQLTVTATSPGHLVVTGQLPAGSKPMLAVSEISDPSAFARTAFIEALQRAGVTVTAAPTGPNPEADLPAKGSYQAANLITEHTSATLGEYAKLIMKVSYNRGADLMACLAAVAAGSTDCDQGIATEVKDFTKLGVSKTDVFPFDGAGSDDRGRATPRSLTTFYRNVLGTPYGATLRDSLPILGRDGTLANVLPKSPAAGKVEMKTGNRAVGTPAGQLILLGNSLAGYVHTKSGKTLVVSVMMANMPFAEVTDFTAVTADQAKMVEEMQQAF